MVTAVTSAAVPMPVDVVAREQPVNCVLEVGLGAAAGLDECDAGGRVWDEDVTQAVAASATELEERVGDIGDQSSAGAQLNDLGMHRSIIAAGVRGFAGGGFATLQCLLSASVRHGLWPSLVRRHTGGVEIPGSNPGSPTHGAPALSEPRTNVRLMNARAHETRTWNDDQLAYAVAVERSWRGVCRALGLKGTSAGVLRSVKRHAERLQLDTAHFTHQRTWSDTQLREAVNSASTWSDVLYKLGLSDRGETRARVKGHAVRLALDVSHLQTRTVERVCLDALEDVFPSPSSLRVAAEAIAIAWLTLRGVPVAVPAKSEEYDLLASFPSGIRRVQVKSTTNRSAGKWLVGVGRRPYAKDRVASKIPYDPDSLDYFFLINGEGAIYLIPSQVLAGRTAVYLDTYAEYLVGDAASLLRPLSESSAARATWN